MASAHKFILFFVLLLYCTGCSDSKEADCSSVLCVADETISLEILLDGENVLADGTYTVEDISVTGKTQEPLSIQVVTDIQGGPRALLLIDSPDWTPGEYFYTIQLGEDWTIPVAVLFTEPKSNDPCCGDRLEILNLVSSEFPTENNLSYYTLTLN